jgi:hypothetical protein
MRELFFYSIAAVLAGLGLYLALAPEARMQRHIDTSHPLYNAGLDARLPNWRRFLGAAVFLTAIAAAAALNLE